MTNFQERSVQVRNVRLSVLDGGLQGGLPLVFIHGLRDVAWSLVHVAEPFADRHRILIPNLRGHGASDRPGAYAMEHFIYDLYRTITELCDKPAILVGHSLGGQIASRFAAVFPELVTRIMLLEGLGPPDLPVPESNSAWVMGFRQRLLSRYEEQPRSRGMSSVEEAAGRLIRNNPRMAETLAAFIADKATVRGEDGRLRWNFDRHAESVFVSSDNEEAQRFWQEVQCPALVISGDQAWDYWGPMFGDDRYDGRYKAGEMDARAAIMPHGRHVPFQNSGHMIHYDEPERVVSELERFIEEGEDHE